MMERRDGFMGEIAIKVDHERDSREIPPLTDQWIRVREALEKVGGGPFTEGSTSGSSVMAAP